MQIRTTQKSLILYTFFVFSLIFSVLFSANKVMAYNAQKWWLSDDVEIANKIALLPKEVVLELAVPVLLGVSVSDLEDTWGDARGGGRKHEGIDIMAPKGTLIVSPTEAVVTRIGYGQIGGNVVYTENPGGESFYYAHLDKAYEGLKVGDILVKGSPIGYVGNSGNAKGGASHLHFTIYNSKGPLNPYPRLTSVFSKEESDTIIGKIPTKIEVAKNTQIEKVDKKEEIKEIKNVALSIKRDLKLGMQGEDVEVLQSFLVEKGYLNIKKTTGYFGPLTKKALSMYQADEGISPAVGYLGKVTKAHISRLAVLYVDTKSN